MQNKCERMDGWGEVKGKRKDGFESSSLPFRLPHKRLYEAVYLYLNTGKGKLSRDSFCSRNFPSPLEFTSESVCIH
jgi:hypothetical protein